MKILVLGAGGMIGHKMVQVLGKTFPQTFAGVRKPFSDYQHFGIFHPDRLVQTGEAQDWARFEKVLAELRPQVILNCIGITLRKEEIKDLSYCQEVNSLFPHKLKCWSAQNKAKLINFSTDCVFDGAMGSYTEDSPPSAKDIYGKTKYLGEVIGPSALTLRGSMIGRELSGKTELLEWALSQKNQAISGYSQVLYSGVTTQVMADLVVKILQKYAGLSGLYQVSAEPISKYELLKKLNVALGLNLVIKQDDKHVAKKDLISTKIRSEVGFICPSWDDMISQLAKDPTAY